MPDRPVGRALSNSRPMIVDGKVIGHAVSISVEGATPPPAAPLVPEGKVELQLSFRPDWVGLWAFMARLCRPL